MQATTCPPHWWVVGPARYDYAPRGPLGLLEITQQRCKICGVERRNEVLIPPEGDVWEGN